MKTEEINQFNSKLIRPEKILYFLVIYLMFYGTSKRRTFCRDMGIGTVMFDAWMNEKQHEAEETIRSFKANLKKELKKELVASGAAVSEDGEEVPTVDSIKDLILGRLHEQVRVETDPAKLAAALKVLQKYGTEVEEKKSSKKVTLYDELKNGGK